MKAVEWVEQFKTATTPEELALIMDEYGKETVELMVFRSKSSTEKSRLAAMDGAVNEQRNKFRAITGKVPAAVPTLFDDMLDKHAKDYTAAKTAAAAAKIKEAEARAKGLPIEDGKKMADSKTVGKFKPRNQHRTK